MRRQTLRTDRQIGSYRLIRLVAEGGMGQVYEAVHVELGRRAALKLLRADLARDEETAARFFTEARAASLVAHAGLVQVYEYGHLDDGGAYIVMEYVQGELLRDRMQRAGGSLPASVAVPIGRQLASALHAAHEKGIVHRDLKPENIKLVPDDEASIGERARILDFGIAKLLLPGDEHETERTHPGKLLGTPVYMAPEQAGAAGRIGPHTDVYALGVVLFELLAGHPPFVAEEGAQLIGRHRYASPPLLRTELPDADLALDELLQQMLAKTPEHRPTMQTVVNELGKIDRRLRSKVSDLELPVEPPVEELQRVNTVVFRKNQPERSEVVRFHERNSRSKISLFLMGLFVAGVGSWMVLRFISKRPVHSSKDSVQPLHDSYPRFDDMGSSGALSEREDLAPADGGLRPLDGSVRAAERPQKSFSYNPNDVAGTLILAQDLLEKGKYNRAVELAKSIQKKSPFQAWRLIGIAACRSKNIELVNESYAKLDVSSRQHFLYSCQLNGIEKIGDGFRFKK